MIILFYFLPFITSFLVVFMKKKIVNAQSGAKFTTREMFLDGGRILLFFLISIVANVLCGKAIPVWGLFIDIFMMIAYLLTMLQKNYDYIERKAFMGIWAFCIIMLIGVVVIFQMLIGTYDLNKFTLFFCYNKGVTYFCIAIWCCFTTGKEKKVKHLICGLLDIIKKYSLSPNECLYFGIISLFLFTGYNDYFTPICIFGFHEIINKKKIKGILYIVLGNFVLFLQYKYPLYSSTLHTIYMVIAFIDLLIQFFKLKKNT